LDLRLLTEQPSSFYRCKTETQSPERQAPQACGSAKDSCLFSYSRRSLKKLASYSSSLGIFLNPSNSMSKLLGTGHKKTNGMKRLHLK
jgi:hypothetical protein